MRATGLAVVMLCMLQACRGAESPFASGPWVRVPHGYSARGEVRVLPGQADSVRFHIRVQNRSDRPARYTLAACQVAARAYPARAAAGRPVWASLRIHLKDCSSIPTTRTLAPGDSLPTKRWDLALPVSAILGDSLPPGRYRFTVLLPLAPPADQRHDTFVPAGTITLRR